MGKKEGRGHRIPPGLMSDFAEREVAGNNRNLPIVAAVATLVAAVYLLQYILLPGSDIAADKALRASYLLAFGGMALLSVVYLGWHFLLARGRTDWKGGAVQASYAAGILVIAAYVASLDLGRGHDYSAVSFAATGLALGWRGGNKRTLLVFGIAIAACAAFIAASGLSFDAEKLLPLPVAFTISLAAAFILEIGARRAFLLEAELREQSSRDPLTGLRNRRFLNETASFIMANARRNELEVSLVVADIDHFKRVNDEHGHLVGDSVLRAVGRTIGSSLRASDLVVRYGGEEFLAVLLDTSLEGGILTAERLRSRVGELELPELGRKVSISCGVAALKPGEDFESCLARADEKLYEAKRHGRNRCAS